MKVIAQTCQKIFLFLIWPFLFWISDFDNISIDQLLLCTMSDFILQVKVFPIIDIKLILVIFSKYTYIYMSNISFVFQLVIFIPIKILINYFGVCQVLLWKV